MLILRPNKYHPPISLSCTFTLCGVLSKTSVHETTQMISKTRLKFSPFGPTTCKHKAIKSAVVTMSRRAPDAAC